MSGDQEPHTNGLNGDASDDEDQKNMRPVDIEADVKEMERRKRVEAIMNSQVRFDEMLGGEIRDQSYFALCSYSVRNSRELLVIPCESLARTHWPAFSVML